MISAEIVWWSTIWFVMKLVNIIFKKTKLSKNSHISTFSRRLESNQNRMKKFGNDWHGTGEYNNCDAFAKYFAKKCRNCKNSNQVKKYLLENVKIEIIWKGDRIRCIKSACTLGCKICMRERKEILQALK